MTKLPYFITKLPYTFFLLGYSWMLKHFFLFQYMSNLYANSEGKYLIFLGVGGGGNS